MSIGGLILIRERRMTGSGNSNLYPIIGRGRYGYINQKGQVIIEPRFEMAKRFSEGLARVKIEGKWGFIDPSGKIAIKAQFQLEDDNDDNDTKLDFHEGMAAVSPDGVKWGFINKQGQVIIAPRFGTVARFSEEVALVSDSGPYPSVRAAGSGGEQPPTLKTSYI